MTASLAMSSSQLRPNFIPGWDGKSLQHTRQDGLLCQPLILSGDGSVSWPSLSGKDRLPGWRPGAGFPRSAVSFSPLFCCRTMCVHQHMYGYDILGCIFANPLAPICFLCWMRGERGDCTLGCFGGHLGTRDVGCWGAAVQRDGEEAACLGNTGSLPAAAVFSLSLYSKEILLFSL